MAMMKKRKVTAEIIIILTTGCFLSAVFFSDIALPYKYNTWQLRPPAFTNGVSDDSPLGRKQTSTPADNSNDFITPVTEVAEKTRVISAFNAFENAQGFIATDTNCTITRNRIGNINVTYILKSETGERFVVQELSDIFVVDNIDHNIQLLEVAQAIAHERNILPNYWQDVGYLNAKDSIAQLIYREASGREWRTRTKIYRGPEKYAWRVMEYVEGTVIDAYSEIPEVFPRATMAEAAMAQGEAIAIFGAMMDCIPAEEYKEPLPGYHAPAEDGKGSYHFEYAIRIVDRARVPFIFSRGADLTEVGSEDPNGVCADWDYVDRCDEELKAEIETYLPDERERDRIAGLTIRERLAVLIEKLRARQQLSHIFDSVPPGIQHGDTKINNFNFIRDGEGRLRVSCLFDLDTIQKGCFLDIGDALRSSGNIAGIQPPSIEDAGLDIEVICNIASGYLRGMKVAYDAEKAAEAERYVIAAMQLCSLELIAEFIADSLIGNKFYQRKPGLRPDITTYRCEIQMKALEETERLEAVLRNNITPDSVGAVKLHDIGAGRAVTTHILQAA
ncbi:phosphotransferase [Candidatus Omnitrophota bacterium]